MNKLKIFMFVVAIIVAQCAFAESIKQFTPMTNGIMQQQSNKQNRQYSQQLPQQFQPHRDADREAFAKRLGLTEEQKRTLDRQRNEDLKEIKPVLNEMAAKRTEFENIENSNMPQIEKEAKMLKLKSEMRELKAKADEKRSQNMKRFEAVLTDQQKAEFEKIKSEGRQKHYQPNQVESFGQQRSFQSPQRPSQRPHGPQRF